MKLVVCLHGQYDYGLELHLTKSVIQPRPDAAWPGSCSMQCPIGQTCVVTHHCTATSTLTKCIPASHSHLVHCPPLHRFHCLCLVKPIREE